MMMMMTQNPLMGRLMMTVMMMTIVAVVVVVLVMVAMLGARQRFPCTILVVARELSSFYGEHREG